ncbi:hypothetical protein [Roseomonas indoligenes]|uniref:Uncharacterized protein n=1 Tax=Roseomonas indoligenes TaxID=2820811 RepID=A0A940S7G5_9PROT|nr:hypothetical protein [Pararoseomonas indoligenes]MBP0493048.1 hypothetical protein [Pararoseomonas indoligenes]
MVRPSGRETGVVGADAAGRKEGSERRLRIVRGPRMDEAMVVALGMATVIALRIVVLVLDEAGDLDAQEVADLLVMETPIHDDVAVQTFARLMVSDLVKQIRGGPAGVVG